MKKHYAIMILTLMLGLILIISGCGGFLDRFQKSGMSSEPIRAPPVQPLPTNETNDVVNVQPVSCRVNGDCSNLPCIDGVCRSIASLYDTDDCEQKCSLDSVVIETSDSEIYTLKKGQGSFSYAGAVEWKIESFPDYCPTNKLRIPLKIIKKNTGKVIETQIITLGKGETSPLIIHPTIERVKFTATLKEINEQC